MWLWIIAGIYKLRLLRKIYRFYGFDVVLTYINSITEYPSVITQLEQIAISASIKNCKIHLYSKGAYVFYIVKILKTSKPGNHEEPLKQRSI